MRSLPIQIPVLVADTVLLNGFRCPANTPKKEATRGWQNCTVKESKTDLGTVLWLLFPTEEDREFGLILPKVWKEYDDAKIDFQAGGKDGFIEKQELEQFLRLYISS